MSTRPAAPSARRRRSSMAPYTVKAVNVASRCIAMGICTLATVAAEKWASSIVSTITATNGVTKSMPTRLP